MSKSLEYNYHFNPLKPGVVALSLTKKSRRRIYRNQLVIPALIMLGLMGFSAVVAEMERREELKDLPDTDLTVEHD